MKNFNKWLDTFLEEKEFDLHDCYTIEQGSIMKIVQAKCVVDFIKTLDDANKKLIKDKLVQIDLHNGNIGHFFKFLATWNKFTVVIENE